MVEKDDTPSGQGGEDCRQGEHGGERAEDGGQRAEDCRQRGEDRWTGRAELVYWTGKAWLVDRKGRPGEQGDLVGTERGKILVSEG